MEDLTPLREESKKIESAKLENGVGWGGGLRAELGVGKSG